MTADLLQALRDSTTADQDYIGWMNDIASSGTCPISTATDHSYQAAQQESATAVAVKKEFAALWQPVAAPFGLPVYTDDDI
jgi:hypothetical protein